MIISKQNDIYNVEMDGTSYNLSKILSLANMQHIEILSADLDAYAKKKTKQTANQLHPVQQKIIYEYTDNATPIFSAINQFLRNDLDALEKNHGIQFILETMLKAAILLSATNKNDLNAVPMVAFRGEDIFSTQVHEQRKRSILTGEIMHSKQFLSTSITEDGSFDKAVKIIFTNLRGRYIRKNSKFDDEYEFLVPPTQIRLLKHATGDDGKEYMLAQIVESLDQPFSQSDITTHKRSREEFEKNQVYPDDEVNAPNNIEDHLEFLTPIIYDVNKEYLSNTYNSLYLDINNEDAQYTRTSSSSNKSKTSSPSPKMELTIPRSNHGLAHTLRVVWLVLQVFKFYAHVFPKNYAGIDKKEVLKIQVAMLFSVVGRQNEMSRDEDQKTYELFHVLSANAFKRYAMRANGKLKNLFKDEKEIDRYAQAILSFGAPDQDDPIKTIMRQAHNLDLMRCYDQQKFDDKVAKPLMNELGSQNAERLLNYAASLLINTGDRILAPQYRTIMKESTKDYDKNEFARCNGYTDNLNSQANMDSVKYCISRIKEVNPPQPIKISTHSRRKLK